MKLNTQVTLTIKRLPTLADYDIVGLSGGTDEEKQEFGDDIFNLIVPQLIGKKWLERDANSTDRNHDPIDVIYFLIDSLPEGHEYAGYWSLPTDIFTVKKERLLQTPQF